MLRPYQSSDYLNFKHWHELRGSHPLPEAFLSSYGLVSDECAIGFVYPSQGLIALIEGVVSDPTASKEKTDAALDSLIEGLVSLGGCKRTAGFSNLPAMVKRLFKRGWDVKQTYFMIAKG